MRVIKECSKVNIRKLGFSAKCDHVLVKVGGSCRCQGKECWQDILIRSKRGV